MINVNRFERLTGWSPQNAWATAVLVVVVAADTKMVPRIPRAVLVNPDQTIAVGQISIFG